MASQIGIGWYGQCGPHCIAKSAWRYPSLNEPENRIESVALEEILFIRLHSSAKAVTDILYQSSEVGQVEATGDTGTRKNG